MIHELTGKWVWKGAHQSYLGTESNIPVIPNWFQPCQCSSSISSHFNFQTNVKYQCSVFRHTEEKTDNIDEFCVELKQLAACSFHDLDAEVKSHLITGGRERLAN